MTIRKIYRKLYSIVVGKLAPVRYARKIGVNMQGKVYIYGKINWSTEPWLITLGRNVHITNGVTLVSTKKS